MSAEEILKASTSSLIRCSPRSPKPQAHDQPSYLTAQSPAGYAG